MNDPFVELCGIEFDKIEEGHCEGHCVIEEKHLNPWGISHGGLLFTLLDTIAGTAGRYSTGNMDEPKNLVTLSSTVYFVKAALPGLVVAKADVVKSGKNIVIVDAAVYSGETVLTRASFEFFCVG